MVHLLSLALTALLSQTPAPPRAFAPAHAPGRVVRRINLNTATSRQLRELPGVGELIAQRIIAARPLRTVGDLQRVKGITPTHFEQLRALVAI